MTLYFSEFLFSMQLDRYMQSMGERRSAERRSERVHLFTERWIERAENFWIERWIEREAKFWWTPIERSV